jgi:hypothetical protein
MSEQINLYQEPFFVGNQRVPWWAAPPMLLSLWTLWVFTLGPTPTPSWMRTSAIFAFGVPVLILAIGVCVMFWNIKRERDHFLTDLGFQSLDDDDDNDETKIELEVLFRETVRVVPLTSLLKEVYIGEWNGLSYEYITLIHSSYSSRVDYSIVTVRTAAAPSPVLIVKMFPKLLRVLYIRRLKTGSKQFRKRWVTLGDHAAADFLITPDFESEINSSKGFQGMRCFWIEDRFGVAFRGVPTRAGIEHCFNKVYTLSSSAGITHDHTDTR